MGKGDGKTTPTDHLFLGMDLLIGGGGKSYDLVVDSGPDNTGEILYIRLVDGGKIAHSLEITNGRLFLNGEETGIVFEQ
ncbi:MAG: hypothetical protein HQ539_01080 [Parcubacteria group bacterium]|nr:hypothetical protein [Parcubacteria group bacterium]